MDLNSGLARSSATTLLRLGARVLTLALAAVVVGAVAVVAVIPRVTHGQAMTVLSGSMTPGIPVGSIVLVRPVDADNLNVGDVATYQATPGKPVYVTHRVLAINHEDGQKTFTFKGDANRAPDSEAVVAGQIRGKLWFHVPYLGTIRDRLHSPGGAMLALCLLLAGYGLTQLIGGLRDQRKVAHHVAA